MDNFYPDLPFGIAQQGKAFRNEIVAGNFIFRLREFEQMEIEYFIHPENWDTRLNRAKTRDRDAKEINLLLSEIKSSITKTLS